MKRLVILAGLAIVLATALLITPTLAETVILGGEESLPSATPWYGHWWVWAIGAAYLIMVIGIIRLATFEPKQRSSSFGEDL